MIIDYSSTAAYICPECGRISAGDINIFNFSGGRRIFRCSDRNCGANCVSVRKKQEKYIFEIECPVCSETHAFPITCGNFWGKEFLTFLCPVSDAEIFFKGTSVDIEKALDDVAARNGISDSEESLLYDILEELYMLAADNSIYCECGNTQIDVSVLGGAIALVCKKCGATKIIEISAAKYKEICSCSSIIIKK